MLVEQGIFYPGESEPQEFYMSVLLNRESGKNIIMYSTEGGMDIETVAEKTPHLIFKEEVDPGTEYRPSRPGALLLIWDCLDRHLRR